MEFRVRGVATNLPFLLQLLTHSKFQSGDYNTRFIDETPELFETAGGHGQVERLLRFIADVIVNGNGDVKDRPVPFSLREPAAPVAVGRLPANGPKAIFDETGARGLVNWIREQKQPLVTDTTFRDAHQSLLATRLRPKDMLAVAPCYAHNMSNLFSVESWGGATFDVALRFLHEDPWQRLFELSGAMPTSCNRCCCGRRMRWVTRVIRTMWSGFSPARPLMQVLTYSGYSTASTGRRTCRLPLTR